MAQASIFRKAGVDDIYVGSVTITEDLQNQVRKRPKGKKKTEQTALPTTKLTDKKKIIWAISGTGYLLSDSDAIYPTAQNKYDALMGSSPLGMMFSSGGITFIHRSREYTGVIEKLQIREDSRQRANNSSGGVEKFEINFTIAVGTVK